MLQILFDFKLSRKNLQELQQNRLDHHILEAIKYFDNKEWPKFEVQYKVITKKSQTFLNNTLKKMPKIIQSYWQIVKSSFPIYENSKISHEKWSSLTQQNIYQRPFYQILQYYDSQSNKERLLEYCEKCLNNFPSNDLAYYYKGKISIQQNKIEDGVIFLKLGHDLNQANTKINEYLSDYYEKKKNYIYCIKYLECLKKSDPTNTTYIDKCCQIRQIAQQAISKQRALKTLFQKEIIQRKNSQSQQFFQKQQKLSENSEKIQKKSIQPQPSSQFYAQNMVLPLPKRKLQRENQNEKPNKSKNNFIQTIKLCQERLEGYSKNSKIFDQILQNSKIFIQNVDSQNQAAHLIKLFHRMIEIKQYNMMVLIILGQFHILRNQRKKAIESLKKAKLIIFIDKQLQYFGNNLQMIQNYLFLIYNAFKHQKIGNEYLQRQLSQFINKLSSRLFKQQQIISKLIKLKNKIILSHDEQITTMMYVADLLPKRVGQYLNQIFLREQKVYLVNNLIEFREKIINCRIIISFPQSLPLLGVETQNLKNKKLTVYVVDTKINSKEKEELIRQSRSINYSNFRINIEVNKPFTKIFQLARKEDISISQSK